MLTIGTVKIEITINIRKKENFKKSIMHKIIKITQINMKAWDMMSNMIKKMRFKHQKIPVDSTWNQAIKTSSMIQISQSIRNILKAKANISINIRDMLMTMLSFRMIKKKILMIKMRISLSIKMKKWRENKNFKKMGLIICMMRVRMMKMSRLLLNTTKTRMIWHTGSLRTAMMRTEPSRVILRVPMSRRNISMILIRNINSKIIVSIFF